MPAAPPRTYRLDRRAMAQAGASLEVPLCLARSAWGSTFALAAAAPDALELVAEAPESPSAVGVVRTTGPLAQEADQLCGWYDGYEGECGLTARFCETIGAAEVGAVVLAFNVSPGGTSAGLEEAVRRMVQARDAAQKPVFVHVNVMCASAAYWIAACLATHGIWAPIAASIGSIGSYIPHDDYSGMLAIEGIKETLIADPPGKVAGAGSQPLDELGRSRLERSVRACTARFVNAVAVARGLAPDVVRGLDGDVLPTDLALAARLIDGDGSLEDVLAIASAFAANPQLQELA